MNINDRITETKFRSTGFNYIRIVLAVAVILFHTVQVCYGVPAEYNVWTGPFRPLVFFITPAFSALAGFLVAGSLDNVKSVPVFLTFRAMRIYPALFCDLLISAFVIGPALTTDERLRDYFLDPDFSAYMLNLFGLIHFRLPGVFTTNPSFYVNGQLWTIPPEIGCYILLAALGALTVFRRPLMFGLVALAVNALAFSHNWSQGLLVKGAPPTGSYLIASFMWASFLFVYRKKVPFSLWLCAGSALVGWVSLVVWPPAAYLAPLPIAYITVYLGLLNPRKVGPVAAGDFSYGIYLYGFPIQQAIVYLLPGYRIWWFNFVVSLVLTSGVAWLSWTFVESRVLAKKRPVAQVVDRVCRSVASYEWRQLIWPSRAPSKAVEPDR